jgi:hypothetical protein
MQWFYLHNCGSPTIVGNGLLPFAWEVRVEAPPS